MNTSSIRSMMTTAATTMTAMAGETASTMMIAAYSDSEFIDFVRTARVNALRLVYFCSFFFLFKKLTTKEIPVGAN